MKMITNEMVTVGAGSSVEDSRKRLLEAKRAIYLKIRAAFAKERPVMGVGQQTQQTENYDYGHLVRNYP